MKVRNGSGVSIMQSPSHRAGYNAGTVYGHREVNAAAQLDAGSPNRPNSELMSQRALRADAVLFLGDPAQPVSDRRCRFRDVVR